MAQIVWMDRNTWSIFNLAFARTTGGECKYVCVMARHDDILMNTEWLIADITATFTLAPDVYVVSSSKSVLGGMFGSSK